MPDDDAVGLTAVVAYFPLPVDRGDPARVLTLLRVLARAGGLTVLAVRRPDTTPVLVDRLRAELTGATVRDFAATPYRVDSFGPAGRYPQAALAGLPPWVRTRYSRELHEQLRSSTGAAIAIGEAAGAYAPGTRLRWHWDKANVLAASARQDVAEAAGQAYRLRARYLAAASMRFERRILSTVDTVSVTSDAEAGRLLRHHGRRADFVLPGAVPVPDGYHPAPQDRTLVWLGSFAYRSNLLGLRRFLAEGWPPLAAAGYRLLLVGSGLADRTAGELRRHPGVEPLGYVDDLRPVLGRARAGLVPLWSGAGLKQKTLTLLAHRVPVFSTPIGAEGVPPSPAVQLADTPAGLANQLLIAGPSTLDAMAAAAVRVIRDHFTEERFAQRLTAGLTGTGYLGGATLRSP